MSDPNAINYQPLEAMEGVYGDVLTDSLRGGWPLVILVTVALMCVVAIVSGVFALAIYPAIGYGIYFASRVKEFKNNIWQSFAAANSWPLDMTTSPLELVPPSLQFGYDPHYSPVVQAQLGSLACDLLLYDCTTGSGKSSQTHYFTVGRVPLQAVLPHLLLLSKKARADVHRDLADSQDLQLEGDFNDYFKLQIEKGQQIDVLTVLTPDVMQTLVNYGQNEDIEILGRDLYFILGGDKRDAADIQSLIQSVVELTTQIVQNISQASVPAPTPPSLVTS